MKKLTAAALLLALLAGCSTAPLNKPKTCPVKYNKTLYAGSSTVIKVASEPKVYTSYNECL